VPFRFKATPTVDRILLTFAAAIESASTKIAFGIAAEHNRNALSTT
jgi:hypothetical protein